MASAGRILIMPKGNYDSSATYEMLDMVHHNGTSWLAKKTAQGIEPSAANSEYWHNMFNIEIANNLTTTEEGKALDARQGKILADALGGYKILTKTYIGTTDENGFLTPYDTIVASSDILSCTYLKGAGFCTPYRNKLSNQEDMTWSFLIEKWDKTPFAHVEAAVKVVYLSKS